LTPIIQKCSRKQIAQIIRWRENGWLWKEVAEAMGFNQGTLARYERLYYKYGLEAFRK
jgi:hypothetical protein